jgi:hypothetical protein
MLTAGFSAGEIGKVGDGNFRRVFDAAPRQLDDGTKHAHTRLVTGTQENAT